MVREKKFSAGVMLMLAALALLAVSPWPAEAGKLKEGDPFPHFEAKDLEGKSLDTKSLAGNLLLVDFWSTTCISCLEEMPHVVALYNKYKDQGFVTVGVNMDRAEKRVKKFIAGSLGYEMPFRNIVDSRATIMRQLSVQMLPTTILVDPSGVVRLFHVGYKPGYEKELEEKVLKYLPAQ